MKEKSENVIDSYNLNIHVEQIKCKVVGKKAAVSPCQFQSLWCFN